MLHCAEYNVAESLNIFRVERLICFAKDTHPLHLADEKSAIKKQPKKY
jgi:hypothetical protein